MIQEHQKSCGYQGLSFDIIAAHFIPGMQTFENICTLSDEGPRADLRCSLFSGPPVCPRLFSVSPELCTEYIVLTLSWPKAPFKKSIFLPRASCTLRRLAWLLPVPTSATTPGRTVTYANTCSYNFFWGLFIASHIRSTAHHPKIYTALSGQMEVQSDTRKQRP